MKDLLFQLKNHQLNTPPANAALMNRAVETLENYRALTIDMLAALSWLNAVNRLPPEINLFKLELNARDLLDINYTDSYVETPSSKPPVQGEAVAVERVEVIGRHDVPAVDVGGSLPVYKICPRCGDRNAKIVHLRRRPRAELQCAACSYEYPFPHKWL